MPSWGVNVELRLSQPPRHSIEEAGIESLKTAGGAAGPLFSLVTRGGVSALGSTFLPEQPDPAELAPALLERGTRFMPAAGRHPRRLGPRLRAPRQRRTAARCSARSPTQGLFVATGHGPWGVSLGPGSARLVADAVLGKPARSRRSSPRRASRPRPPSSRYTLGGAGRPNRKPWP